MERLLYRYNPWWEKLFKLENIKKREAIVEAIEKKFSGRKIIFLTGLRRVGKTTIMKLLIKNLIEKKNTNPKNILYMSMDDYLLSKKTILDLLEEYRKLHKIEFQEKIFIFLDEITHQENFELQLKNIFDSQNVKICCSSSSASILKNKKAYLTGRNTIIEILPLDFREYLEFKNIKIKKSDSHITEKIFEEYLVTGGMPEYVCNKNIEHLKELVDDILYRDIAAVHNIKNPQILKDFFILLMERSGKIVSINKVANILDISVDTAKRYLQMFAETYLIYRVARWGKTNEKLLSPKKIYAADLGIRALFTGLRDKGSFFENYIFLKIKNKKPYYISENGIEIDFFTAEDRELIEVKYQSRMTEKQEILFKKFPAKKKKIIESVNDALQL